MVSKTLSDVESKLPGVHFARIHQSHLVNLEAIHSVSTDLLRMSDDRKLPIARSRRKALLSQLNKITISL
jgi:DNA-binding LytR/AlgR family response regulator